MARGNRHKVAEFPMLRPLGLKQIETKAAGNCMFHACSDQLYGHQENHFEIRAKVVEHMREHSSNFKPFVSWDGERRGHRKRKNLRSFNAGLFLGEGETQKKWEEYLTNMAKLNVYGTHVELQAFAQAYGLIVRVFNKDRELDEIGCSKITTSTQVIYLAYHVDQEHYSSIRNLNGPDTGLPYVDPKDKARKLAERPCIAEPIVTLVDTPLSNSVEYEHVPEEISECCYCNLPFPLSFLLDTHKCGDLAAYRSPSEDSTLGSQDSVPDLVSDNDSASGYERDSSEAYSVGTPPPTPFTPSAGVRAGSGSLKREFDSEDEDEEEIRGPTRRYKKLKASPKGPKSTDGLMGSIPSLDLYI